MSYIGTRGYVVSKDSLTDEQHSQIHKDLTVSPKVIPGYGPDTPVTYKIYQESTSKYYLPKIYGLKNFGVPSKLKLPEGDDINISFKGELRPLQIEATNQVLEALHDPARMGALLCLLCGQGKTISAVYVISVLAKKALVVVHKDFLLTQWRERISEFAPDARIGLIKGPVIDVENKDIVLASLQSLAMKEYDPKVFESFATLCVDECFPYTQEILTDIGPVFIGTLFEMWKQKMRLPKVMSYNTYDHFFEWKEVTYSWKKYTDLLLELNFGKLVIRCTPNHKIYTPNGMFPAESLRIGDMVISYHEGIYAAYPLVSSQYINTSGRDVYDIEISDNHNFVCCDEDSTFGIVCSNCHHTSAEVFSQALKKTCFRYTLGLTATPTRKDGLTHVFLNFLGDIAFKSGKRKDELKIIFRKYYENNPSYSKEHTLYNKKPNIAKMLTQVCDFQPRTDFIVQIIHDIITKEPDRRILVLSERREHVKDIQNKLMDLNIEVGLYLGGMKEKDLKDSESKHIIVGTYALTSEGFDVKELNTLVLTTSKTDVEQIVGRIQRTPAAERKHTPLVIDIVDMISSFPSQAQKRKTYYKKCGYDIEDPDNVFVKQHKNIQLKECMID